MKHSFKIGRIEIKCWNSSDFGMFNAGFFYRISLGRITIDYWKNNT